jgi:hypothetical protein
VACSGGIGGRGTPWWCSAMAHGECMKTLIFPVSVVD